MLYVYIPHHSHPHRCSSCYRRCSCQLSWTQLRHSFEPDLQWRKEKEEEEGEEENGRTERERIPSSEPSHVGKRLNRSVYGGGVHSSVSKRGQVMRRGFPHPHLPPGQSGGWRILSSARVESVLDVCRHPAVSGEGGSYGQLEAGRQTDRQTDRQADRQTDRQTDRKTDRQTDRQIDR